MMVICRWSAICSLAILISSCNLINPQEQMPSYIQVDSVSVSAGISEGSSSSKITDLWLYSEIQVLGVFAVPSRIALLKSGINKLVFNPGILDNGIDESRAIYPFYYPDTITLNLEAGKVTKLPTPVFHYRAEAVFKMIEDFETGNGFTKFNGDTSIHPTVGIPDVFEGNKSGEIILDSTHLNAELVTINQFAFPGAGSSVYVEMNYRSDADIEVGIIAIATTGNTIDYRHTITARSSWNKIYLNFTDDIKNNPADHYQILIRVVKPDGVAVSKTLIDNFKIVSF